MAVMPVAGSVFVQCRWCFSQRLGEMEFKHNYFPIARG